MSVFSQGTDCPGCQVVFGVLLDLLILFFWFDGIDAASLDVEWSSAK